MAQVFNRTNTHTEAYFNYLTGLVASSTKVISSLLSADGITDSVSTTLSQLVWRNPVAIPMAPITFTVAFIGGGVIGLFSSHTSDPMSKIYANIDKILGGGAQNKDRESFKVSLIFALFIANKIVPGTPSLAMLYAAVVGGGWGKELANKWVPKDMVISIARFMDHYIPPCPGFEKQPPSED